ncbi:MAG: leucine--tRNA ligase [Bacillati bacterium ANGP1]|uniref:Leucine--tRNA ligase n=1 Tax=Candidatus Segetimicrobium genomatis TaxID=2569760 RepID=A0A537J427_9BACT|nr:MAG: leucine--tRNA ligase [Terrabacteria group bacterium ANGP1]
MGEAYDPKQIEPKWQARWEADGLYRTGDRSDRPKFYFLTMYPYPSGDLHIGHWFTMTASDAKARFLKMRGLNVFFPIGFDAFGLPAENAAIQHGTHPYNWTMANIERMRGQLRSMGAMFDWSREVVTCLPEYYAWNQWFFLKFHEAGLAYRAKAAVDWCPHDNTTLAREQVIGPDRVCERCGTPVIKKDLEQWFFRITKYTEELLDFSKMEWPERVQTLQRNWIGRSEGAEIVYMSEQGDPITVFTTRPDTLFGATFLVLAPEHPLVDKLTTPDRRAEVASYVHRTRRQSEIERLAEDREKTGVFIGAYARHPLTNARIPIYIGDYVLLTYGTGAIHAVPAHDPRDFVFAGAYGLPIPVVIAPPDWDGKPLREAYVGEGVMVNSGPFDGTPSQAGRRAVTEALERAGRGRAAVTIPVVHCDRDGIVGLPDDQLPLELPLDADYHLTDDAMSTLAKATDWVNTTCPTCGGPARRETDTMDTFVDSSWYQYRYLSPHDRERPFDPEQGRKWLPVDQYTGGIEHAVLHLLYTRFFTKAMRVLGLVSFDEPMLRLFNQGIILGPDGHRMSKSRGNVVNPDDYVGAMGVDTVRAYLMFIGPWDAGGPWNPQGIEGVQRFLQRVWHLIVDRPSAAPPSGSPAPAGSEAAVRRTIHQTLRRVTEDLEGFRFNTALAALMECTNALYRAREAGAAGTAEWAAALPTLVLMLAPFAPHQAEELWSRLGRSYSVHQQAWPAWDPDAVHEETITLVLQVNGRVRDRVQVPAGLDEAGLRETVLASEKVRKFIDGMQVQDVIVVRGKLVNVVVR